MCLTWILLNYKNDQTQFLKWQPKKMSDTISFKHKNVSDMIFVRKCVWHVFRHFHLQNVSDHFSNWTKNGYLGLKTCQTLFLVKIVSDHFLVNQKHVRHLFKCQNWPKFPGVKGFYSHPVYLAIRPRWSRYIKRLH